MYYLSISTSNDAYCSEACRATLVTCCTTFQTARMLRYVASFVSSHSAAGRLDRATEDGVWLAKYYRAHNRPTC